MKDKKSLNNRQKEFGSETVHAGIALSNIETVNRFGSANAEFIKGYSGIDNETGQQLAKGLADIAKYKVNPEYEHQNIKQQAGFSAEIGATSRDNAESIINRSNIRTSRSDDLVQYGKNHNVIDRVQILDGNILEGSQSQMKFVGDRDNLLKSIAQEDGKFARYRGVKLELPSEQYDGAASHCYEKSKQLRFNAGKAEELGNYDIADKLRHEANNYDQLANNVRDTGLTTEDAIYYRKHPKMATIHDISRTSHRAGIEGAKAGLIIGGAISIFTNAFAVAQEKKQLNEAAKDIAIDTAQATTLSYAAAYTGSAIKGVMQQSGQQTMRTLANTSLPTLVIGICVSLSGSIKSYTTGEISEAQLLSEVGEKGAGMLTAGMMAAIGQLAIPIPLLGAAVGGMIGYTLSSFFYQSALEASKSVEHSREVLKHTRYIQEAARIRIAKEQSDFDKFVCREIPQLQQATRQLFTSLNLDNQSINTVVSAVNQYATLLGKQLEFQSIQEFDEFMSSDSPLIL